MIAAVISPSSSTREVIAAALERTGQVEAVWSLPSYPDPRQLKDLPRDPGGCTVFLDFSDVPAAKAIAEEARKAGGSIKVVGMTPCRGVAGDLAVLGIGHEIGLPPPAHEVLWAFAKLNPGCDVSVQDSPAGGRVFAFLPARPGAGATTLAVHTAAAVARLSQRPALLMDFDFRLGMTSFLLKLPGQHSVVDALNDLDRLNLRWDSYVNRRGQLDILGSAPQELSETNLTERTALLLNFARERYATVVIDLPGEMREYEINVLRRSTSCFLVCNSDIGVMHMAQRKSGLLHGLVLEDKTSVVLNRAGGLGMISPRDVEAILRLPVRFSVANAYKELVAVTRDATTLEGRGGVITQIENIARWMMPQDPPPGEQNPPAEESGTRRFLEFFSKGGRSAGR